MKVFKEVARINGVSVDEVKDEIAIAIKAGFSNPDPKIRHMWNTLFPDGNMPTPEEFVYVMSRHIIEKIYKI
ncbi:MAG: hypothetical protein IJW86_06620 [Clostridia bacterium]|nr:hypothetical protein [Clostridia bacterium]